MVAPPRPFTGEPMKELKELGSNWVAIVPYGYTMQNETAVYYDSPRQWWGERTEGTIESIKRAQKHGLKILLKPHVYVPGAWPGDIRFETEKEWATWEENYRNYILHWTHIADSFQVDALSIGTEFKVSSTTRSQFWLDIIQDIRCTYNGYLTYCANWDEFQDITFWGSLDFIGVDAYFPLSEKLNPTKADLMTAWKSKETDLSVIVKKYDRPLVFTEYGYMSVDGAASKTWELESKVNSLSINETAQAIAIDALWSYFEPKDWWLGGFYWKWFPEMQGHEGYPARDYTFQGKEAEETIRKIFKRM